MEGNRIHEEGTRKDFVSAGRRVVVRIHEEMGPNVLGLRIGHRWQGSSVIPRIFVVDGT